MCPCPSSPCLTGCHRVRRRALAGARDRGQSEPAPWSGTTLVHIARELVETVKKNATIDWTARENVRAQLRVVVKRILRKYGYPPDKQEQAAQTVLQQAEVLSEAWAVA